MIKAKCKHLPTITSYVSPLKICPYGGASDFVYGVLAYFHNIIKTRNILKNIPRFWYASSKHIPYSNKLPSQFVTNTPYVSPLKNCLYSGASVFVLWGSSPYNPKNNKKAIRYKYLMAFLVRWKGLEPPTYWFVASHSIQLSYQRIYVLHFLCSNNITQIK